MFDDEPYQNAVLSYTERRLRQRGRMPELTTCTKCRLPYYQTSAPHVCAEWTRGAKENRAMTECQYDHPWKDCPKCGVGICAEHTVAFLNHPPHTTEHEPAARGGEDEWQISRHKPSERADGQRITVITAPHPEGGGQDIIECLESVAEQIVTEHNQHHSLLAGRERLREAIEVAIHNLNAGNDPRFLADYLRLTLDQKEGEE